MIQLKCIICETPVDLESFSRFMCPTCGYINDMLENIPEYQYGFYVVHEKQIAVLPISLEYSEKLPDNIRIIIGDHLVYRRAWFADDNKRLESFLDEKFHGTKALVKILMKKSGLEMGTFKEPECSVDGFKS